MGDNKLFDIIENLNQEFINFWIDVSNIESPTDYKTGVDSASKLFIDYAKNENWDIEISEYKNAGNCVCITMNSDSNEKPITLSGHLDTVHPLGSFGNPPVRIDGDCIYGPGVMDCKGGTVAALYAMTALKKYGFKKRPIKLLLQTDEESNSKHSNKETIKYMCKKASDSIAFLNCESIKGNTAVLSRRGIVRYRYDITGTAIHASKCNEGSSAIAEAAIKILKLEKYKDVNGITCNVGIINGGNSENTVPDFCSFTAEFRFEKNKDISEIEKIALEISNNCEISGTCCRVTRTVSRYAMELTQRNIDLLNKINEIFKQNNMPVLSIRKSLGGSDAADITEAGIPCIDSIGVAGDFIHTRNEYAYISSLSEAAKRIAVIIKYI